MSQRSSDQERRKHLVALVGFASAVFCVASSNTHAVVSNSVAQWNKIAEDAVIRSNAFQNEGLIYMAYVSAAVYHFIVCLPDTTLPVTGR